MKKCALCAPLKINDDQSRSKQSHIQYSTTLQELHLLLTKSFKLDPSCLALLQSTWVIGCDVKDRLGSQVGVLNIRPGQQCNNYKNE